MKSVAASLLALGLIAAACSGGQTSSEVTVFAAASLSDAFGELAAEFEQANPDVTVVLNLAGSQTLATQILEGAQPDVFASADDEQMTRVVDELRPTSPPEVFVTNSLSIVTESGNPLDIAGLADLGRPGLRLVLGAPEVPVGRYSTDVLVRAGVEVDAVSMEPDVRSVLTKVALGEADAGIVYRTDAASAGDGVEEVGIPAAENVVAEYPIVGFDWISEEGRDFLRFVLSERGADVLRQAGFGT